MTQSSQFGHAIADSISGVYKSGGEQPLSETHACMVWEDILLCLWHVTPGCSVEAFGCRQISE